MKTVTMTVELSNIIEELNASGAEESVIVLDVTEHVRIFLVLIVTMPAFPELALVRVLERQGLVLDMILQHCTVDDQKLEIIGLIKQLYGLQRGLAPISSRTHANIVSLDNRIK